MPLNPPLVGNHFPGENLSHAENGETDEEGSLSPSENEESDDDHFLYPPSTEARTVSAKARQLGCDVVECTHPRNLGFLPLPAIIDVILRDDVSIVMRKIVKKIVLEKQLSFHRMIQSVLPSDLTDLDDFRCILSDVVRHLVAGASINSPPNVTWGKIVTAYAFGGLFANVVIANNHIKPEELGNVVGDVINEVAGAWIHQKGGWNSFAKFFDGINTEESITRNLVYLFGASTAAVVGLVCWKSW